MGVLYSLQEKEISGRLYFEALERANIWIGNAKSAALFIGEREREREAIFMNYT